MIRLAWVVGLMVVASLAPTSTPRAGCEPAGRPSLSKAGFETLMNEIAQAWNMNDARRAASCFTSDAIYSSMPHPDRHVGRAELFRWFGGETGRPRPMRMRWHHLVFDADQQLGVGEYTFRYDVQTHGLVLVRLSNGLVANWREYEVSSPRSWEELVGATERR